MPRKTTKTLKRTLLPDLKYNNVLVTKMANKIMRDGKKRLAESLLYEALTIVETKSKQPALEVFENAIKNVAPALQVKAKRIGGATYQVPMEVRGDRKIHLAMTWILNAARAKSGKGFDERLADELLNAYNNQGDALRSVKTPTAWPTPTRRSLTSPATKNSRSKGPCTGPRDCKTVLVASRQGFSSHSNDETIFASLRYTEVDIKSLTLSSQ
jgi:small subunit ribosomal protein S7